MTEVIGLKVAVIGAVDDELTTALAAALASAGALVTRELAIDLDGAVVVAGLPSSYSADVSDVGGYVGAVLRQATGAADVLRDGHAASRSIVFVAPPLGAALQVGPAPISAVAGALYGLARALTVELGDLGIRANTVQPGLDERFAGAAETGTLPIIPLRRQGVSQLIPDEDIAHTVRYLLSADSLYVSGVQIEVDGAYSESRQSPSTVLWANGIMNP